MSTVPALLNDKPRADCADSRLTICGVLTVVILKLAISPAPGLAGGLGVVALVAKDQGVVEFHFEPVPSQNMLVAETTSDKSADPIANASQQAQRDRRILIAR